MSVPADLLAEPTDHREANRAFLLRSLLSGATLVMVALSWPLWIDLADFPSVPFVRWFPDYPRPWSWIGLLLIVAGLATGMTRRFGRIGVGLTIPVMIGLIIGDQLRFQPWVYQFLVLGSLLVLLPPRATLAFGAIWMASIYLHSGLSKLDASFVREMGPLFVRTLARVLGLVSWPVVAAAMRSELTALSLPVAEIVVALLLAFRPTRRLGYVGALLIHLALLLILGPWGLGHSLIVLVWNVALAAEEFVLFWPKCPAGRGPVRWSARERLVAIPFGLLLVMPLGERVGLFDSWPSHALYASHAEGTTIGFRGDLPADLPRDLRIAAQPTSDGGTWLLNPTDWARRVRGVPAYPQVRYGNALAEWVMDRERPGTGGDVFVAHRLRADARTGAAEALSARNLKEARELSGRFWFNAHPRDHWGR